jgi:hypothetical protein
MRTRALATALAVLLSPSLCRAASVLVTFEGVLTTVSDPTGEAGVTVGMPFTATAAYDDASSAPPVPIDDGFQSSNAFAVPPASFSLQVGPWSIGAGPVDPDVPSLGNRLDLQLVDRTGPLPFPDVATWHTNVAEVDGLDVPFLGGGSASGFCCSNLLLILLGPEGTLPSLSLSDIPFDLSAWSEGRLIIDLYLNQDLDEIYVEGSITSISVIPEPSTGALYGAALLALAAVGRRARRSAGT